MSLGAHLKDLTLLIGPYSASSVWAMEKFCRDHWIDRDDWIVPLKPLLVQLNRNKPFLAPPGQALLVLVVPKHQLPSFSLHIGLSLTSSADEVVETIETIKYFSFLVRTLLYTLLAITSTLGMMGAVVIVIREVARQVAIKQTRNVFEREGVRLVVS